MFERDFGTQLGLGNSMGANESDDAWGHSGSKPLAEADVPVPRIFKLEA
jgi:hypothetical protein